MKTIEIILAEEKAAQEAYEQQQTFKGETIANLRKIFEKIQAPEGWKEAWAAAVPHPVVGLVMKAVEFFHADKAQIVGIEAITGRVLMQGKGYQG